MLQHPDLLYRDHQLRHQELVAEAERFRLARLAVGRRSWEMGALVGLVHRVATLASSLRRRAAAGRRARPSFDDGAAKSAS